MKREAEEDVQELFADSARCRGRNRFTGSRCGGVTHAADPWSFSKIADTSTAIPGGTGNFIGLGEPSFDGGSVAFVGVDSSRQRGIYSTVGGTLGVVADKNTVIPGGNGTFTDFYQELSLDGGSVAFLGFGSGGQVGIYSTVGGTLGVVADKNTAIPDGTGTLSSFGSAPSLDGGSVAFESLVNDFLYGIYLAAGGTIEEVVRESIMLDGKTVRSLTVGPEGLSDGSIAFSAVFTDLSQGIYVASVVPVPAALPLFGSALALLGVAGWRRRRTG